MSRIQYHICCIDEINDVIKGVRRGGQEAPSRPKQHFLGPPPPEKSADAHVCHQYLNLETGVSRTKQFLIFLQQECLRKVWEVWNSEEHLWHITSASDEISVFLTFDGEIPFSFLSRSQPEIGRSLLEASRLDSI